MFHVLKLEGCSVLLLHDTVQWKVFIDSCPLLVLSQVGPVVPRRLLRCSR